MNNNSLRWWYFAYRALAGGSTLSLASMAELYRECDLGLSELCLLAASVNIVGVLLTLVGGFVAARLRYKRAVMIGLALLAFGQLGYVSSATFSDLLRTECINAAGFSLLAPADTTLAYYSFGSRASTVRSQAGFVFHFAVVAFACVPMLAPAEQVVYLPCVAAVLLVLSALVAAMLPGEGEMIAQESSLWAHLQEILAKSRETLSLPSDLRTSLVVAGTVFTLLRPAQFMVLPFLGECHFAPAQIAEYIAVVNLLSALFMGFHPVIAAKISGAVQGKVVLMAIAGACLLAGMHPSQKGVPFLALLIWSQVFAEIGLTDSLNTKAHETARLSLNVLLTLLWRLGSALALLLLAAVLQHGAPSRAYCCLGAAALTLVAAHTAHSKRTT